MTIETRTDDAARTMWEGKYLSVRQQGSWEYAERRGGIDAAVIVALDGEGQLILVEQYRIPIGRACLELPAGLVGDTKSGESIAMPPAASWRRRPAITPPSSRSAASSIPRPA